jgi:O-antigen/teichoic acid export membrane protein
MNNKEGLKNLAWLVLSNLVLLFANFGISIILANKLGVHDYGIFALANTIFSYMIIVNNYGLKKFMIPKLSKNRELSGEYFLVTILIKVILATVSIAFLLLTLHMLHMDPAKIDAIILFLIASAIMVFDLQGFYDSFNKSRIDSLFIIIRNLLYVSGVFILISVDRISINSAILMFVLSTLIYVILQYSFSSPMFRGKKRSFNKLQFKELLIGSAPLFWADLMINVYDKSVVLFLAGFKSEADVGIYSVASRMVAAIILVVGAVYRVFLPSFSILTDNNERKNYVGNVIKYLGIITIPLAFGGIAVSNNVIELLYSAEYSSASTPLQILLLNVIIVGIGSIFGTVLLAIGKVKYYSLSITGGAIVNVIFNVVLIPYLGVIGASISAVSAQLTVSLTSLFLYKRYCDKDFKFKLYKVLVASLIMCGICFFLGTKLMWPLYVSVPMGVLVYVGLLLLFGTVKYDRGIKIN